MCFWQPHDPLVDDIVMLFMNDAAHCDDRA